MSVLPSTMRLMATSPPNAMGAGEAPEPGGVEIVGEALGEGLGFPPTVGPERGSNMTPATAMTIAAAPTATRDGVTRSMPIFLPPRN